MQKNPTQLNDSSADARRESELAGDDYYRTITDWVVSRLANGSVQKCYDLAVAYDRAIDRLIDRLKAQVKSASSLRSIDIATKQKTILNGDLEYLGNALVPVPTILDFPDEPKSIPVEDVEAYARPA